MNKIGIIQGRLSEPKEGFQHCPVDWRREFDLLDQLSLTHIEWIISDDLHTNPIFFEDVDISRVSCVCLDNLVDERITDLNFLQDNLFGVCEKLSARGIKNISIPLLEKSSLADDKKFFSFKDILADACKEYASVNFLIETELHLDKVVKLCDVASNVRVTYDTGNTTSFGIDHVDFIDTLSSRIDNVHLKDRTFGAVSLPPGQGNTDFRRIFSELKRRSYNKNFTLQTMREKTGEEIQTIKSHVRILKEIFDRA